MTDPARREARVAAAALLRQLPSADAFERLAAHIDESAAIAAGILEAVEERMVVRADASCPPVPVDPRWRAVVRERECRPDDVGALAAAILRAWTWYEGGPPTPVREVELGEGDDPPFPFMVLGWETDAPVGDDDAICSFFHQYGGYACLHARLVGLPLALPEWGPEAAGLAREHGFTAGERLDDGVLRAWGRALGLRVLRGWEALLVAERPVGMRTLLRLRRVWAPWWPLLDVASTNAAQVTPEPCAPGHVAAIARRERELGPASAFVLWGNTD
jgi:hypothetical protein